MTIQETIQNGIPTASERWNAYAERRFVKQLTGTVAWCKARTQMWSDADQFDAQTNRYPTPDGAIYKITITVGFKPPAPDSRWIDGVEPSLGRAFVAANKRVQ